MKRETAYHLTQDDLKEVLTLHLEGVLGHALGGVELRFTGPAFSADRDVDLAVAVAFTQDAEVTGE